MKKINAFTLIEVLLVIAIISILAAIVIVAINPAKQIGEAQNAQRQSDVRAVLDAVVQYSLDNDGALPAGIPVGTSCASDGSNICKVDMPCSGTSLDVLISQRKYLTDLPVDPTAETDTTTGYSIMQNSYGRVGVCATTTYGSAEISVMK